MSFLKKKNYKLSYILKFLNLKILNKSEILITGISGLDNASYGHLTICSNSNYIDQLKLTKASACLIPVNFLNYIPTKCIAVVSKDPTIDFIKILNLFYKDKVIDTTSNNLCLKKSVIKKKYKNLIFGNNFSCEKGVKIGKNVNIGHNVTIKESVIDNDVIIGNNVTISNSVIKKNVNICDGSIIGKKGFGFKFHNGKLFRIPHIGKVIINEGAEIGSNCNIDRGSISDTVIGRYTFIDNQVQIAHNVKIGDFCMIAAQVGISGSAVIGNNVSIGGQSGISGHLKIGNNVKIGGKSGVIKNIEDKKRVMGYPAVEFREFIKKNKN